MNHLIIKIESGVVADIWHTGPLTVTVIDYDVIDGEDDLEARMRKAVLSLPAGEIVAPEGVETLVKSLAAACKRPIPGRRTGGGREKQAA